MLTIRLNSSWARSVDTDDPRYGSPGDPGSFLNHPALKDRRQTTQSLRYHREIFRNPRNPSCMGSRSETTRQKRPIRAGDIDPEPHLSSKLPVDISRYLKELSYFPATESLSSSSSLETTAAHRRCLTSNGTRSKWLSPFCTIRPTASSTSLSRKP